MSINQDIQSGIDYSFTGDTLEQGVFPFTLAVYEDDQRAVVFKPGFPPEEAERVLHLAAKYLVA